MDKINDFAALAEVKLSKIITEELTAFLLEFSPELGHSVLLRQVRAYFSYADKPVEIIERDRRVTRTFWYLLRHPEFRIVNEDELQDGYFQLLLFPDFQVLHPLIRRWRDQAGELNISWGKAKEIVETALQKLSRETSMPTVAPLTTLIPRAHDPLVSGRYTVIANVLSKNPRATAVDICKKFDLHNIPVLDDWKEAGINDWTSAYANVVYRSRVQKLISVHKSAVRNSLPNKR